MPAFQRACDHCTTEYTATRSTSRYCGAACRSAAARNRRSAAAAEDSTPAETTPPPDEKRRTAVEQMTRRDLERAQRVETVDGQAALALAIRIDEGGDTGSALASLITALNAALGRALGGTAPDAGDEPAGDGDPIINLQERRERRRGSR